MTLTEQLAFHFEDDEIWKPVVGYEGLYEVSNRGRVRSLDRRVFNGVGYYVMPGRILKQSKTHINKNYQKVLLKKPGEKHKNEKIHRLVAMAFIDKPSGKDYVNHLDGDKANNNVENLEWCNLSENSQHAMENGLSFSNFYPNADAIVKEYIEGFSLISLAKKYKCSTETITKHFERTGVEMRSKSEARKILDYNKEDLISDFDKGLSYRELEKKYGMKYHTLAAYKHLHRKGELA